MTTSGDTASFLAGGEFPFPVSAENNQISIEFKQFGVALAFTPTVLSGGLINLKIAPEVSDIDETNSVEVNNVRIPGLIVRRANTTVELKDGQSLAIAGLLQHAHRKSQQQLPWIGQVPVLGALFRSAEYQKEETDLVIIVTPRLVKPARPGERLKTPLDEPMASNDRDFFLNGRSEITESERRRGEPRFFGHIITTGADKVTALLVIVAIGLSGCRQYLDRGDTITAGVADATDTNKAVQTITRWPPESRYDRWRSDGERARVAIDRYKKRTVTEPRQLDKDSTEAVPASTSDPAKAN